MKFVVSRNNTSFLSLLFLSSISVARGFFVVNTFWDSVCQWRSQTTLSAVVDGSIKDTVSLYSSVTVTTVQIPTPMGIVIEEIDSSDTHQGVRITRVEPDGNAAASCGATAADLLCVRDKILAVNGVACSEAPFEVVMDNIRSSTGGKVELTLGRPRGSVIVKWPNGVCVAAQPGEYLGNIGYEGMMQIPYSCRSGSCGTCEQVVSTDNGNARYLRPCFAKIPKGVKSMIVIPSDRYHS